MTWLKLLVTEVSSRFFSVVGISYSEMVTKTGKTAGISGDNESDRCDNEDWFNFLVGVWGGFVGLGILGGFYFFLTIK